MTGKEILSGATGVDAGVLLVYKVCTLVCIDIQSQTELAVTIWTMIKMKLLKLEYWYELAS
jgi:hypothetical protein